MRQKISNDQNSVHLRHAVKSIPFLTIIRLRLDLFGPNKSYRILTHAICF